MKKFNKILNLILPLLTVLALILIWTVASKSIDNEYIEDFARRELRRLYDGEFYIEFK